MAPYIAPTIMWMTAPSMAAPGNHVYGDDPPIAPFTDNMRSFGGDEHRRDVIERSEAAVVLVARRADRRVAGHHDRPAEPRQRADDDRSPDGDVRLALVAWCR